MKLTQPTRTHAAFLLLLIGLTSCLKQKDDTPPGGNNPPPVQRTFDWEKIADSAQTALNLFFWNAAGGYFTLQPNTTAYNSNYWPNAHALDVLTDKYNRKNGDASTKQQMEALVAGLRAANGNTYSNFYYDDMQWLLISSLRAFRATGDTRFKSIADGLWPEVKGGWDALSGGGFYWRKDRLNKNTPANAPAAIFAARLYQTNNNSEDLTWARNTWNWLKAHLIQPNGDVWDGLYVNTSPVSYDTRLFTYNYGTVIGTALELFKITADPAYRDEAVRIAGQCITALGRDNLLAPGDLGDGGLFNGIFVRYLTRLIVEGNLAEGTRSNFVSFLQKNAETMWQKGTLFPAVLIGPDWKTTPTTTTLTAQLSGVMLLEAMAELKRLNLVK